MAGDFGLFKYNDPVDFTDDTPTFETRAEARVAAEERRAEHLLVRYRPGIGRESIDGWEPCGVMFGVCAVHIDHRWDAIPEEEDGGIFMGQLRNAGESQEQVWNRIQAGDMSAIDDLFILGNPIPDEVVQAIRDQDDQDGQSANDH